MENGGGFMSTKCSCVPCKFYETSLEEVPCKYCRDHSKFKEKDTYQGLKMKPHFGQSDAAMNKLAGCNSFPNKGVIEAKKALEDLEERSREAGFRTPHEYLTAINEEAAGMPLEPSFIDMLVNRRSGRKVPNPFGTEGHGLKERTGGLKIDIDCDFDPGYGYGKLRKALEQISTQPLEPAHIYEIAERMKRIAKSALED